MNRKLRVVQAGEACPISTLSTGWGRAIAGSGDSRSVTACCHGRGRRRETGGVRIGPGPGGTGRGLRAAGRTNGRGCGSVGERRRMSSDRRSGMRTGCDPKGRSRRRPLGPITAAETGFRPKPEPAALSSARSIGGKTKSNMTRARLRPARRHGSDEARCGSAAKRSGQADPVDATACGSSLPPAGAGRRARICALPARAPRSGPARRKCEARRPAAQVQHAAEADPRRGSSHREQADGEAEATGARQRCRALFRRAARCGRRGWRKLSAGLE